MKIDNLYLCLSNYSNQFDHLEIFKNESITIYDKSESGLIDIDSSIKINKVPNVGYNIFPYLNFIIENYSDLPEHTIFLKDNVFNRHFTYDYFLDRVHGLMEGFKTSFSMKDINTLIFPSRLLTIEVAFVR